MELVFRIREDRLDKHGRAGVWADIHWPGHRVQPGVAVKVEPTNWQPTKEKRIKSREADSNAKNLRLQKVVTAVGKLFTAAEAEGKAERDVTEQEVHATIAEVLGSAADTKRTKTTEPAPGLTPASSWAEFNEQWKAENAHLMAKESMRQYNPVVTKLAEFDAALCLQNISKVVFGRYVAMLQSEQKKDSTIQTHYKFLRECFRMVNQPVPSWLSLPTTRQGRAASLKKDEFLALVNLPRDQIWNYMHKHLDLWIFQTLLLLRDSDLRALQPHHVKELDLPLYGPTLCAEIYQEKTMEPLHLPLPPLAASIWRRYNGRLPVLDQSGRGKAIKKIAEIAGLTREFVKVQFSGKTKIEQVGPIWKFLGTHAARHTGADLLMLGSGADKDLKELALGHKMPSVYGYDSVERYGPAILDAWRAVLPSAIPLAKTEAANASGVIPRRFSFFTTQNQLGSQS
ncbi:hypothetical protein [Hymenobacter tenuis]